MRSGDWSINDGWLTGINPKQGPGLIFSKADYSGDVMLDFEARTVPPSTHDIDWMFHACWDLHKQARGTAYVGVMPGWWDGKLGIEKSPDYKLLALRPLPGFEPGRTYRVQSGVIAGHVFIFVDGFLMLELTDPDPIDSSRSAKIGFEAYASMIQVRNLTVYSPAVVPR